MKTTTVSCLLGAVALTHAATMDICYDITYDNLSKSLSNVACSGGANGLITKYGFKTFADIPCNIASLEDIVWNSDQCGECIEVTWNGNSMHFLTIDGKTAGIGVDLAEDAMNELTNGHAEELGVVEGDVTQVALENCLPGR